MKMFAQIGWAVAFSIGAQTAGGPVQKRTSRPARPGYVRAHGASQGALSPGTLRSPDGRYEVRVEIGEAECGYLLIRRLPKGRGEPKLLRRIEDVEDFMWLPERRHTLVFSTGNTYGDEAMLALWAGTGIRKLKGKRNSRLHECFWIHGASPDGRVLIYSHASEDPRERVDDRTRDRRWIRESSQKLRLVLPASQEGK
jgi:hypothetical protein